MIDHYCAFPEDLAMEYRNLGTAGIKVSPLCLGTMMFGGPTDEATSIRMMHHAYDLGINFFDTANVYNAGESERVVGKAISDRRDRVVLATKGGIPVGEGPNEGGASRVHLMRAVEDSLRRLGTDVIDLYYLHKPDPKTPIEETWRALDSLVQQGKIRYIGVSNFRAWELCGLLTVIERHHLERITCLQPLYNLVNRDAEEELLPLCRNEGIGVVSYSPLARGVLSGKYRAGQPYPEESRAARGNTRIFEAEMREESFQVADRLRPIAASHGATLTQFALSWCLANRLLTAVIIGPRTMAQLDDNMGCLNCQITPEDEAAVDFLVPPGEHTGRGFNDPVFPIAGRR
ncbi:MAG: aldo/keto reductase [Candidatus Latescibacterota bacterium]